MFLPNRPSSEMEYNRKKSEIEQSLATLDLTTNTCSCSDLYMAQNSFLFVALKPSDSFMEG